MLETPGSRAAAILVLLVGLFAMAVWFGSLPPSPDTGDYPGNEEVTADDDRYLGDRVSVSGDVVATDPVRIAVVYGDRSVELVVPGVEDADVGDHVAVYGVLDDGAVRPMDYVIYESGGLVYAYLTSAVAGLWVLVRIVRDWRYDPDAVGLRPTGEAEEGWDA